MNYLEEYYNSRDEDSRLLSRHGQVEYLTTMKYIRESLAGLPSRQKSHRPCGARSPPPAGSWCTPGSGAAPSG